VVKAFAAGTVTGFGSVFVNGVRFDDSSAQVDGDDDTVGTVTDLKIGMQVEVESGDVSCTTDAATGIQTCAAKAAHIAYGGQSLVGPIDTGSLAAGNSFTLLGQKVTIGAATTVSFDSTGLTALAEGLIVEVHGSYDKTTGETAATRIEARAVDLAGFYSGASDAHRYRLRGALANLDTTLRTATVGGQSVHFADGLDLSTLVTGATVRVRLVPKASADAANPWEADKFKLSQRGLDKFKGSHAELEGTISDWVAAIDGNGASFKLDGAAVTVVFADVQFADGATAADLMDGTRVEVAGTVDAVTGALVARKIEIKRAKGGVEKVQTFEYHGVASGYDATAHTFQLRGELIEVTADTSFKAPLSEADLASGTTQRIEVKGVRSADGTRVVASLIKAD
jgi:hypothetical protein